MAGGGTPASVWLLWIIKRSPFLAEQGFRFAATSLSHSFPFDELACLSALLALLRMQSAFLVRQRERG